MKSNLRKLMAVLLTVALLWTTVIPAFAEDVLVPEEDVIFAEPVEEAFVEVEEDLGNGLTVSEEEVPIEAEPVEAADDAIQDEPADPEPTYADYHLSLGGDVKDVSEDQDPVDYRADYTGASIAVTAALKTTGGAEYPNDFHYKVFKANDQPTMTDPISEEQQAIEAAIKANVTSITAKKAAEVKDAGDYVVYAYVAPVEEKVDESTHVTITEKVVGHVWGPVEFTVNKAEISIVISDLNVQGTKTVKDVKDQLDFTVTGLKGSDTKDKLFATNFQATDIEYLKPSQVLEFYAKADAGLETPMAEGVELNTGDVIAFGEKYPTKLNPNYTIKLKDSKPDITNGTVNVIAYTVSFTRQGDLEARQAYYKAAGYNTSDEIQKAFGIKVTDNAGKDVTSAFTFAFVDEKHTDVGSYKISIKSTNVQAEEILEKVEIVSQPVSIVFSDAIYDENEEALVVKYNGAEQLPEFKVTDADGNDISDKFVLYKEGEYDAKTAEKPKAVADYTIKATNVPQTKKNDKGEDVAFTAKEYNYTLKAKPYFIGENAVDAVAATGVPFKIVKREITVSGMKVVTRPYAANDCTATLDVSEVKFQDAADGTEITTDKNLALSVVDSKAAFKDANAGTEKTVYFNLKLDATSAASYILVNTAEVKVPATLATALGSPKDAEKLNADSNYYVVKNDTPAPVSALYTSANGVVTPIQLTVVWKDGKSIYTRPYDKTKESVFADATAYKFERDTAKDTNLVVSFKDYVGAAYNDADVLKDLKDCLTVAYEAVEGGPALVKNMPKNVGKYNALIVFDEKNPEAVEYSKNYQLVENSHEIEITPVFGVLGVVMNSDQLVFYDKAGAKPSFTVYFKEGAEQSDWAAAYAAAYEALKTAIEAEKVTTDEEVDEFIENFLTDEKTVDVDGNPVYGWTVVPAGQLEAPEYFNNTGVKPWVETTSDLNGMVSNNVAYGEDEKDPYVVFTADLNGDKNALFRAYKKFNIEKRPVIVNGMTVEDRYYDGTKKAELNINYDEGAIQEGDKFEITPTAEFADENVELKRGTPIAKTVKVKTLALNEEANDLYVLVGVDNDDAFYKLTNETAVGTFNDTFNTFNKTNGKGFDIKATILPLPLQIEWSNNENLVYGDKDNEFGNLAQFKITNLPKAKDDDGKDTDKDDTTVKGYAETAILQTWTWDPDEDVEITEADVTDNGAKASHAGNWTSTLELNDRDPNAKNFELDEEQAVCHYNVAKKPITAEMYWIKAGDKKHTRVDEFLVDANIYGDTPFAIYTGEEIDPTEHDQVYDYRGINGPTIGGNGYSAYIVFKNENGIEISREAVEADKGKGTTIFKSDDEEAMDYFLDFSDNVNAGICDFTLVEEENGNYTFEPVGLRFEIKSQFDAEYKIEYGWDEEEYEVMADDWTQVVDQEYTGKAIELVPWVHLQKSRTETRIENGTTVKYTVWDDIDLTEDDYEFYYYNEDTEEDEAEDIGHIVVGVRATGNYEFTELNYLGYNIVPKKVTAVVKVESPVTYDPYGQYVDYTVTDEDGNDISFMEFDATSGYEGTKVGKYNLVLTDAEGGNYELTFNKDGYAWEIVPAEAELVWANTELNYNGKAQKPTATVKGNANVTVTVTGEQTDAGKHTATASALSDTNYKLPEKNTAEFSIAKLEVTVSNITAASKIEDGTKTATIDASNATFAGLLSGDELKIEKATGEFVTAAPGKDKTVTLKYELAGKSAKNYTLSSGSQKTATATITAKAIIEVDKDDRDYLYQGDTLPVAIYKDANGKLIGVAEVTLVEPAKLNGVGTYKAIAKLPANEKDYVADPVSFEFKVVPHEVSVSWVTDTFTYNGTAQGPVAFVDAETSAYTVTGDSATDAGSYTATVTLKDTKNYTFAKDAKTTQAYTIAQRPVTIAGITANDKVEDGTNTAEIVTSGASFTGKLEKDTLTVTATGAFKDAAVGNAKEIPLTLTLGGKDAKNYTIADGSQKVTKANITAKPAQPSGTLILRTLSSGKDALKLKWKLMQNVDGYEIGYQKSTFSAKNAKKTYIDVVGNKTYRYTIKGLDEKTLYKVWIKAYVLKDGQKKYVATSPLTRSFTGYGTEKYTNAARLRVATSNVVLTAGDTQKITATVIGKDTSKKLEPRSSELRYLSEDTSVATVSKNGTITGVKAGTCSVYVLTGNGLSKKVTVTVK